MDDKQFKEILLETRLGTAVTIVALGIAYIFFSTTVVATYLHTEVNNVFIVALWGGIVLVGFGAIYGIWSWLKTK